MYVRVCVYVCVCVYDWVTLLYNKNWQNPVEITRRENSIISIYTRLGQPGFIFFFFFFGISWAAPTAYGGSQARGRIGAVATSLRQNHSNAGSELRLQPTPKLTATSDP